MAAAPPGAADEKESEQDSRWLQALSEPELDLLTSLKELAVTQAAAHPDPELSRRFHLRTLRALGIVLLQHFKDRLEQTPGAGGGGGIHRLAMKLRDDDPDVPELQSVSNGAADKEPRQVQQGSGEEGAPGSKKRKM